MINLQEWHRRVVASRKIMQNAIDNASRLISESKSTPEARRIAAARLRTSATSFAKVLEEKYQR